MCAHLYLGHLYCYCAHRPRSTLARAHRRRRTGGDCGAQQLAGRPAGADRGGVEVRSVAAVVVAAPRAASVGLHEREPRGLARGGGRGTACRLGLDPHGARRARVAARGTGHVRTCARQHRTRGPSAMPPQPRTPVTRAVPAGVPVSTHPVLGRRLPPASTRRVPSTTLPVPAEVPASTRQRCAVRAACEADLLRGTSAQGRYGRYHGAGPAPSDGFGGAECVWCAPPRNVGSAVGVRVGGRVAAKRCVY
jgi:hypothetical protein